MSLYPKLGWWSEQFLYAVTWHSLGMATSSCQMAKIKDVEVLFDIDHNVDLVSQCFPFSLLLLFSFTKLNSTLAVLPHVPKWSLRSSKEHESSTGDPNRKYRRQKNTPGFFSSIWVRTMSRFLIIPRKYFYIIVNTGAYFTTNLLILS